MNKLRDSTYALHWCTKAGSDDVCSSALNWQRLGKSQDNGPFQKEVYNSYARKGFIVTQRPLSSLKAVWKKKKKTKNCKFENCCIKNNNNNKKRVLFQAGAKCKSQKKKKKSTPPINSAQKENKSLSSQKLGFPDLIFQRSLSKKDAQVIIPSCDISHKNNTVS